MSVVGIELLATLFAIAIWVDVVSLDTSGMGVGIS